MTLGAGAGAPISDSSPTTLHLGVSLALCGGLWLVLVATGLLTRPLMPIDETRYVSVAWEMWVGGDALVPHLNGEAYGHKPPLLFWLINLVWAVFGVSEMAARVVAPMFALGCLFLTGALARRLWPDHEDVAFAAPMILIGVIFWGTVATLTLFDVLLAFFTLACMIGLVEAKGRRDTRGWLLFAVAFGLGVLAKGPVIAVHVLPVALAAPLWAGGSGTRSWSAWYAGLAVATVAGAAIALAWALPAAVVGGGDYGREILWNQTAVRIAEPFGHARPWWLYIAAMPVLFLPWSAWPPLWRALGSARALIGDRGARFCVLWFVFAVVGLSFIGVRQPHYLIPSMPAGAMLAAFALSNAAPAGRAIDWFVVGPVFAVFVAGSIALLVLQAWPERTDSAEWINEIDPLAALPVALAALVIASVRLTRWRLGVVRLAVASVLVVVAGHVALRPHLGAAFDLEPLARHIAGAQNQGSLVANVHRYHGQYQFLGRLGEPLAVTWQHEARQWAEAHPDAKMIVSHRALPDDSVPEFAQRFRGRIVAVWDARDVANSDLIVIP